MADEFTIRRGLRRERAAATGLAPVFARALTKGPRSRLYRIDPIGSTEWRCEVWFGGLLHRTRIAHSPATMVEHRTQFAREIADLITDGWMKRP